jgi:hypothetical protein
VRCFLETLLGCSRLHRELEQHPGHLGVVRRALRPEGIAIRKPTTCVRCCHARVTGGPLTRVPTPEGFTLLATRVATQCGKPVAPGGCRSCRFVLREPDASDGSRRRFEDDRDRPVRRARHRGPSARDAPARRNRRRRCGDRGAGQCARGGSDHRRDAVRAVRAGGPAREARSRPPRCPARRPARRGGIAQQDERFTTAEAERVLIAGDVSRERRKQVIDKQAAALILQGWLDGRHRTV